MNVGKSRGLTSVVRSSFKARSARKLVQPITRGRGIRSNIGGHFNVLA